MPFMKLLSTKSSNKSIVGLFVLIILFISGCQQSDIPLAQSRHTAIATYSADISDTGKYSLVASINHDAGFWDLNQDTLLYTWTHGETEDDIIAVDIATGDRFAVTATEKTMAIWDIGSGKNLGFYELHESDLRDIKISSNGRNLVMGLGDGRVIHLDVKTGRRLEFVAHTEAINRIDISPNGRYVISAGNDYKAIFWDAQSGQPLQTWNHNSRVILASLSRDGQYAFTSGTKADAYIWDLRSGGQISKLALAERQYVLSSARFSNDNKYLLTGAPSRELILWDKDSGKSLQVLLVSTRTRNKPSGAIVYAVGFNEAGDYLTESSAGWGERWASKLKPDSANLNE